MCKSVQEGVDDLGFGLRDLVFQGLFRAEGYFRAFKSIRAFWHNSGM